MDKKEIIRIPGGVILREVGEEAVLLNISTHQYYSLDSIGVRVLHLLTEYATIEQILEKLIQDYNAPPEEIKQDLDDLIANLLEQRLIEIN